MKHLSDYTDQELYDELAIRNKLKTLSKEQRDINRFSLGTHPKGFSAKDFKVEIWHSTYEDKYGPTYSFQLKINGEYQDIYYDMPWDEEELDDKNQITHTDVMEFLPKLFSEASENSYECDWEEKKMIEFFENCRIPVTHKYE